MMSSTLKRERQAALQQSRTASDAAGASPRDAGYKNGGTQIALGSEGSSPGSDASSVDNSAHPDKIDVTIVLPNRTTKLINVDYG